MTKLPDLSPETERLIGEIDDDELFELSQLDKKLNNVSLDDFSDHTYQKHSYTEYYPVNIFNIIFFRIFLLI